MNRFRKFARLTVVVVGLAVPSILSQSQPAHAFQIGTFYVVSTPQDVFTMSYSLGSKTASAEWVSGTTTARIRSWAYCSRASGAVNGPYPGPTKAVNGGTSVFDCDNNGTYNVAITNNGSDILAV